MSTKQCCRTCQHGSVGQCATGVWCRLRKIGVPFDIALIAVCHHWAKNPPSLPKFNERRLDDITDQQLELDRELVAPDKY